MKTTSIKGVLSFCVAVTVTVAMAYSAVTIIQKNNAATEKAVKESQAIGSEVSTDSLKDGEYEGTATGYGGPLTVRITIKGGKLTDIKVVSHTETPEYFSRASAVIGKILNSGNVNVDSVSGATISSNAIKKAVADALRKAGSKQQAEMSTVKKDTRNANLNDEVSTDNLKDGEYEGTATGYGGPLTVRITIKGGKLTDIKVVSHTETPEYFSRASAVIGKILNSGNVNVDSVSGATISSNAIKKAVADALRKAGSKQQAKMSKVKKDTRNANLNDGVYTGAGSEVSTDSLNDGVYTGSGQGFNGPIRVRVTVSGGNITNVEILSHSDDAPYFNRAKAVIGRLLGKPGKSVDTVSGATYSSRGIIDAVRNALANAGKTNITNTNSNTNKPNNNNNNTPGTDNKPPLVNPETGEPSYVDAALRKHYPGDKLKDGEYTGIGIGYLNPGGIKTYVTVKNGEISSLRVGAGDEYRDDMGPFRSKAENVLPFLQGKEGRWNIAKMGLYREYFEAIRKSRDPKAKVKELFGDKYVSMLNGLSGKNTESDLTLMSRTVKAYMGDRYEGKKMFDSVTGATVSASGISAATKEATNKSANDFKMNSDVKEISIIEPKVKTIEVNKGDAVDFSELKIKLVKKDGSIKEVGWNDFAENGLSITDEAGNAIENGSDLKTYGDKKVIKARVVHKESLSYDNFRILVGRYSKDYIVGLEYSKDGSKWYKVSDVKRDSTDDRKIDDQQVVDAPTSFEFENVKIRLVSKEGHRYEYTTDKKPVNRKVKYTVIKDENPNAPQTIFVTFQLSGTEADKELVGDEGSGGNGGSTEEPNLPEVEVDSKVIETVLDEPGRPKWTERMPIKPATVTSLDKDAEMQTTIEGLPKGLKFDGRTITGTPVVEDDNWDGDNGMFKTVTLKFKAKKNGVMLVRKYKYWIYRDKDLDGIADDDEDGGTAFTPQRHNSKPLVVDGKEPTLDDYKALFSNIPADGSVKMSIKQKPDLSKKGTTRAVLEFSVDGVKKNGRAIVIIDVKNPVEESEPNLPEVEVDSKVIETVLDEPGRPKWTERMPIKPATVTSLDKDAEMQTTIEGLPKGLKFDGRTITGTPVVEDDNWDGDNGMFKTVTLKFKAKKNGVMLVRKYKYWIYRDKDLDGIADDDEDGGTAFTPQRHNSKPLVVDGKEPTLDDYKALFSNIPADGSVKMSIKQKPDLSKKGTTRAVLEFSVDGVNKNGRAIVIIDVKNPVEESANATVSSSTRESSSVESVGQPENDNVNKKEDIQKPTESKETTESSSVESVGQPENGNVNKKEDIQKPTESKETTESSSVESVGQPENGNVNKKEDIQEPTESKETAESSAAAEAERMVQ